MSLWAWELDRFLLIYQVVYPLVSIHRVLALRRCIINVIVIRDLVKLLAGCLVATWSTGSGAMHVNLSDSTVLTADIAISWSEAWVEGLIGKTLIVVIVVVCAGSGVAQVTSLLRVPDRIRKRIFRRLGDGPV